MKSADTPADDLFRAVAENVPADHGAAACDSSAEAMTRLRDPFAVVAGGGSTATDGVLMVVEDEPAADPSDTTRSPGGNRRAARSPGRA